MKVIFTFWIGGNVCMDFEIEEWDFPFLPAVGNEVLLYDYFNEDDFDFAKSTLIIPNEDFQMPYDNLIELLFDYNVFNVTKVRWIYGGVEIMIELIDGENLNRYNFKLKFPNKDNYLGSKLRDSIEIHSEAMYNFIYKKNSPKIF